jgi:putative cell wall-binding protein
VSANLAGTIGWSPRAYVATGLNWPDGLAGGAAAGAEWAPLLLTKKTDVPDVVMETLANVTQPEEIVVLGGSNTIDDAVLRELETIAPVTRIGGADRYAVAANVADLHPTTYGATMATGLNWPDALAGSAFAGLVGDKMLLLKPTVVPADTRQAVLDHSLVLIDLLGGTTSVPQAIVDDLEAMEVVVPEP